MKRTEIKSRIGSIVKYKGVEYRFSGCILRVDNEGKLYYQAEITDMKCNSIVICKMEEIE